MRGCCFQAISVCAGSPLFVGSPLQNFDAPWGEPFTLLRNTGLGNKRLRTSESKAGRVISVVGHCLLLSWILMGIF